MNTLLQSDEHCPGRPEVGLAQDGAAAEFAPTFVASPLPMILSGEATGIALGFATGDTGDSGEDRFSLIVVDADGEFLCRFGPFCEDEIVAQWRDFAAKSGLTRMIVRGDGSLSAVSRQLGRVALGTRHQRRRHGLLNGRRPRFLVRRKSASLPSRPQIHRNENEIIARS